MNVLLGLDSFFTNQINDDDKCKIARVSSVYSGLYQVEQDNKSMIVACTGSFYKEITSKADQPVVGDWVLLDNGNNICRLLKRKTKVSRASTSSSHEEQILAANVDVAFVVTSLNKEYNINKIERFIIMVQDHGIKPVIVLSKIDLNRSDITQYLQELKMRFPEVDVFATTIYEKDTVMSLYNYLNQGQTSVFIGSSGVGKSSMINALLNSNVLRVGSIRETDDKGKHTTTNGRLLQLENGSFLIDTPGIRALNLWLEDSSLTNSFDDISILAADCKFSNCTHTCEPGCNVIKALKNGSLSEERYQSYTHYKKLLYYSSLSQDAGERIRYKAKVKRMSKNDR